VLEFKERPVADKLAKSCAAFANTLGGLLIVGVTDAGELAGCERPVGEVQVWLKDMLRPRVTPLPPFRARWVPLDGTDRGLPLVLVERSSTTPHLLINLGAIYVRNPGSSDPVPIHDGRILADLVARQRQEERTGGDEPLDRREILPGHSHAWRLGRAAGDHQARPIEVRLGSHDRCNEGTLNRDHVVGGELHLPLGCDVETVEVGRTSDLGEPRYSPEGRASRS
jgi:Putative DNA-binding domain